MPKQMDTVSEERLREILDRSFYTGADLSDMHCAVVELLALRSAQPQHEREMDQVMRERDEAEDALGDAYAQVMGEMPEWSNVFGYTDAINDIAEEVEALKKAAQPQWVSVKKEKPPYGVPCIVVYQGCVQDVAYSRDVGEYRAVGNDDVDPMPEHLVTHWMHIPPPPPPPPTQEGNANG